MTHQIFICHSAEDKDVADAVCTRLEADGFRCWIAPRDVVPGSVWAAAIHGAIKECRVLLLVHSGASNVSEHVLRELERAVACGVAILPLRISDTEPSEALHYYIGSSHWLDAREPPIDTHLAYLSRSINGLLSGAAPSPATASSEKRVRGRPKRTLGLFVGVAGFALVVFLATRDRERPSTNSDEVAEDSDATRRAAIVGEYELYPSLMRAVIAKVAMRESLESMPDLPRDERTKLANEAADKYLMNSWMKVRVEADGKFISEGVLHDSEQYTEGNWEISSGLLISRTLYDDGKRLLAPIVIEWTFRGGILRGVPPDSAGVEIILRKKRPKK